MLRTCRDIDPFHWKQRQLIQENTLKVLTEEKESLLRSVFGLSGQLVNKQMVSIFDK